MLTKKQLIADLTTLGVKRGDLINLKVSMRSIGKIQGGAETLIAAILDVVGEEGTIVSDSFVSAHSLPLRGNKRHIISNQNTPSYAGVFANKMVEYPGAFRSPHPIQKFVAIGKHAKSLTEKHTKDAFPYNLLHEMAKQGGINIRIGEFDKVIGVGTTHVAICLSGFQQNKRRSGVNYFDENNNLKTFEINWASGCPRGFNELIPYFRMKGAVKAEGKIGNADAMITDMHKTLSLELELAKDNPMFFMCNDPKCYKCRLTWKHSTGKILPTFLKNIMQFNKKSLLGIIYLSVFKNYLPKKN